MCLIGNETVFISHNMVCVCDKTSRASRARTSVVTMYKLRLINEKFHFQTIFVLFILFFLLIIFRLIPNDAAIYAFPKHQWTSVIRHHPLFSTCKSFRNTHLNQLELSYYSCYYINFHRYDYHSIIPHLCSSFFYIKD